MMYCEYCGARTHLCRILIDRSWALEKREYVLCQRCAEKIEAFIRGEARIVKRKPDSSRKLFDFMEAV